MVSNILSNDDGQIPSNRVLFMKLDVTQVCGGQSIEHGIRRHEEDLKRCSACRNQKCVLHPSLQLAWLTNPECLSAIQSLLWQWTLMQLMKLTSQASICPGHLKAGTCIITYLVNTLNNALRPCEFSLCELLVTLTGQLHDS